MTDQPVLSTTADGVATITLHRPNQMNSLDRPTKLALLAALEAARDSDSVRSVLLTAEGRGFCVGQDLREFVQDRESHSVDEVFQTVEDHFNPISELIATMEKPVVCAVQGAAAGAGLSLALASDLRIASSAATFTTAFVGIALSADTGITWYLPRLVGTAKALELLWLSPTVSAEQALELGLVNEVVAPEDLLARAREVARHLAEGPTAAYARIKSLVRSSSHLELTEALRNEHRAIAETGASRDHENALRAFLAKEKPRFEGR